MDEEFRTAGDQAGRAREQRRAAWQKWLKESERLNQIVLAETKGAFSDIDLALEAARADLEARHENILGGEK